MFKIRVAFLLIVAIALSFLWVWKCSGPDPAIVGVQVTEPVESGAPYQIEATVKNRNQGKGQVVVNFTLADSDTGEVYEGSEEVDFDGEETAKVTAEIQAPLASYDVKVKAFYPPQ